MSLNWYETGDTVFFDNPFVHSLMDNKKGVVCDHCLQPIGDAIDGWCDRMPYPCLNCNHMFYCSNKCLKDDKKCHQTLECQIYGSHYKSGLRHGFVRLILRSYLMIMNDKTLEIQTKSYQLYDGKRRSLNGLRMHLQEISSDTNRLVIFDYVYNCLVPLAQEFEFVLSRYALFKVFCRLIINRFAIIDFRVNKCETIALALYIKASVLNHSCDPNSATTYYGSTLALKAIKKIAIGEEITINYCDLELRPEDRRLKLKQFFYFDCNCNKCLTNDFDINYHMLDQYRVFLRNQSLLTDPNWAAVSDASRGFLDICNQIYGSYHPQVITIFIIVLSLKLRNDCEDKCNLNQFICDVRHRVERIFGTNHTIYNEFNECLQRLKRFHF